MARAKKIKSEKKVEPKETDYEQFLINKITKCQRIANELRENRVWQEIREDYEATAKSLDLSWAFEDVTSPRFKQMQAAKMAAVTFMNLQQNYEHDLKLAKEQLNQFQKPHEVIKKDFDEEGVTQTVMSPTTTLEATAYHGRG